MSDKQETVADIMAEMRGSKFYPWGQGGFSVEMDLTPLADRIEAAHKREVEAITAKLEEARHCWKVWSDRADELKNKCDEQYAQLKSVGNADIGNGAKMREALIQARAAICKKAKYQCQSLSWENCNIQANCGDILCSWRGLCEAKTAINAALAAPPRNCDRFGTDNAEASLAYEEFCDRAEVEESVNGAIAWLLSLDTDKEGGAK